jgi:hypothetical protein
MPAQEVEFGGHDGLVLVEEGGLVHPVDLEHLACGARRAAFRPGAARTTWSRLLMTASSGQLMRLAVRPGRYKAMGTTDRAAMVCSQSG